MTDGHFEGAIGFVGLGDMGGAIAMNIAQSGADLLAFDLNPSLESEVAAWGGEWAQNSQHILRKAAAVCICLFDDHQVRNFVDEERVFHTMRARTSFVVFSTVTPGLMRELQAEAAEHQINVLSSPVSGAHQAGVAGTLSVMASGARPSFDSLQPIWESISSETFWLGDDAGAAQAAKLCNNMVSLSVNLVTLEGINMAQQFGIDEETILRIFAASSGDSWMVRNREAMDRMILSHPSSLAGIDENSIGLKDIHGALKAASEEGIELPAVKAVVAEGPAGIENRLRLLKGLEK